MTGIKATPTRALLGTLLLSSAMLSPAFAQSSGKEEITVTAQRGGMKQSIQKIPIAVTAMSGNELKEKSITSFKDLQFSVPSVTFSKGNYGGNNFQIRGIGISSVATSADSGVSIHTNDVYVQGTAGLATSEYYDVERIEVLRGPQSTLYGRNATGGVVNIITAKPDTTDSYGRGDLTYGTYDTIKGNLVGNVVLVPDELAFRLALNYTGHAGYVDNLYTGEDDGDQNLWQARYSLRWTPSDSTTIDLMGAYGNEHDRRVRYPKQLCHRDPTGVAGCLPDKLAYEPVNSFATFGTLIASQLVLGPALGLSNPLDPAGGNATSPVPTDNLEIYSDYDPTYSAESVFYMANIDQKITPWLSMNVLGNYSYGKSGNTNHYNNLVGDSTAARLTTVTNTMVAGFGAIGQAYVDTFFRRPDGSLGLPLSIPGTGGVTAGPVEGETVQYADRDLGTDKITGSEEQVSAELRFNTHFDGPVNFLLAGFYISSESDATYYVNSNTLDYAGIMLGMLNYVSTGKTLGVHPLTVYSPTQFRSDTRLNKLESHALFGEVYWQIADDLKLTGGLRWLEDSKTVVAQTTLFNYYTGIGTNEDDIDFLLMRNCVDIDPSTTPAATQANCMLSGNLGGREATQHQRAKFVQMTGRTVLEWTPEVSWSDSTLVYASYARGFKSGGLNPPVSAVGITVPLTFDPETIDAFEIGTKNRFMDNSLTVNLTGYYYDYKGYQIADIIARTAVNSNIDATIWGLEGEFLYRPDDNWQFNMTLTHTKTKIGEASIVDQRNPTAGLPNTVWVKDITTGSSCALSIAPSRAGLSPAEAGIPGFIQPSNGGAKALQSYGIANVNYGSCAVGAFTQGNPAYNPALGYTYAPDGSGFRQSIEGNELPQQPGNTIAVGAQYKTPIMNDYELTLRADYYWQSEMWTRIMNGPADKIKSWDVLNLSVQLDAADQGWYARLWATNVLDSKEMTGAYLTDASSGLFTNIFVQDPRVIGLTVGFALN